MDGFTDDPKKIDWARTTWAAGVVLLLGYETYALIAKKKLLSEVVWELASDYPILPAASGILFGHFFMPKIQIVRTLK